MRRGSKLFGRENNGLEHKKRRESEAVKNRDKNCDGKVNNTKK
jgi:hypothetical protein